MLSVWLQNSLRICRVMDGNLYGCSEEMKGYIRLVNADFNDLHGHGPTHNSHNWLNLWVRHIHSWASAVIKDNLLKLYFFQISLHKIHQPSWEDEQVTKGFQQGILTGNDFFN